MEVSPFVIASTSLTVVLFSLVIGMETSGRAIQSLIRSPLAVLLGLFAQYLILPIIGVAIVKALSLPIEIGLGLLILASAPGGTLSNALVYLTRGDTMLSVVLTSISSLASPLAMATILILTTGVTYGRTEPVAPPFMQTLLTLIVLVLIPMFAGYGLKAVWSQSTSVLKPWIDRLGALGLIASVSFVVWANLGVLRDNLAGSLPAATLLVFSASAAAWLLASFARLNSKQLTAIVFEVGLQNIALATIVAVQVLKKTEYAIFPVVYGCMSLVIFVPATLLMRSKSNADAVTGQTGRARTETQTGTRTGT